MAARDCTLTASSTYSGYPPPLLETLCRSYKAHSKTPNGDTLKASFQFGMEIEPANFDDALDKTNASFVQVVYDRVSRYAGLWAYVDFVYITWHTDNYGFTFSCKDPAGRSALVTFLDASAFFCRDTAVMQYYHQDNKGVGPRILHPTHQCWREVVNGSPGLHICVANSGIYGNEMHVDPNQIVKGKDSDGTCSYDLISMARHGWDIRKLLLGK